MISIKHTLAALAFLTSTVAFAATPEELIKPLQDRWAQIKYQLPEKQQEAAYHELAAQARVLREANPSAAEIHIWEGIIVSTEAGAKGGLGALSLCKEAKARLDEALRLNDKALAGSAYTSLATLYAKVPGWPIGFGNHDKAEEYFKKALAINPTGIDPNYFYGEYLADRGRHTEARTVLETALKAPARAGRELADSGRRAEITTVLNSLK
jgi:tetratricopeptide (TPR) repeat protein